MNVEYAISNIDGILRQRSLRAKIAQYWLFILFIWGAYSNTSIAQPAQSLYSGLENATSHYVTQNSIYIVEQGKNRLLKLDHSGKLVESIGGLGSGNYQFSKPVDVDATNGLKIFVTDHNNRRIQVFDRRGQYLSSIEAREGFGNVRHFNPTQIAVSDMGEVYFVDENMRQIRHFDLDYNLLDTFRIPIEVESTDEIEVIETEILILDKVSGTIHRLALNGSYRGFYPAEDVLSIFANTDAIWKAYSNKITAQDRSGEQNKVELETPIKSIDLFIHDRSLFVLTSNELFKLQISGR